MLPFWISIAVLSLAQGALVSVPRAPVAPRLARLSARRWAVIPPLSVTGFVFIAGAAEHASAQGLTYLALCAVPMLAALSLGWLSHGARPLRALAVFPLFALAWIDRTGLAGEGSALILSALSCAALGALLAAVTPSRWLAGGILAMAVADSTLVVSELLQQPNNALNAARPAAGLPRLQSAVFGSAVMGYGDLFIAGALGALLAITMGRSLQRRGATLTALFALSFDLLFFLVDELPATVPVALALIALVLDRDRRRRSVRERDTRGPSAHAPQEPVRRSRSPAARAASARARA